MSNVYTVLDVLAGVSVSTPDEWRLERDLDPTQWYPLPYDTVLTVDDIFWYVPGKCWVNTRIPGTAARDMTYYRRKFTISPSEDRESALARKYVGYTAHGLRLELETLKGVIDKITKERDGALSHLDTARKELVNVLTRVTKERDEALAASAQWRFNYETIINDRDAALTEVVERDRDLNARCKELAEVREQLNIALTGRTTALRACDHVCDVNSTTTAAERDALRKELAEVREALDIANGACSHVCATNNMTAADREELRKERDEARVQRDSAIRECDKAIAERDSVVNISQIARSDRDRAIQDRDAAREKLSAVTNDRDSLRLENKSLHASIRSFNEFAVENHADRQAAAALSDVTLANNNRLKAEVVQLKALVVELEKECDVALDSRDAARKGLASAIKDRDDYRAQLDSCKKDRAAHYANAIDLNHEVANLTKELNESKAARFVKVTDADLIRDRDRAIEALHLARSERDTAIDSRSDDIARLTKERNDAIEGRDYARRRSNEYSAALSQTLKELEVAKMDRNDAIRQAAYDASTRDLAEIERDRARNDLQVVLVEKTWRGRPVLNEDQLRHMPNDLPPEHLYDGDM